MRHHDEKKTSTEPKSSTPCGSRGVLAEHPPYLVQTGHDDGSKQFEKQFIAFKACLITNPSGDFPSEMGKNIKEWRENI